MATHSASSRPQTSRYPSPCASSKLPLRPGVNWRNCMSPVVVSMMRAVGMERYCAVLTDRQVRDETVRS